MVQTHLCDCHQPYWWGPTTRGMGGIAETVRSSTASQSASQWLSRSVIERHQYSGPRAKRVYSTVVQKAEEAGHGAGKPACCRGGDKEATANSQRTHAAGRLCLCVLRVRHVHLRLPIIAQSSGNACGCS